MEGLGAAFKVFGSVFLNEPPLGILLALCIDTLTWELATYGREKRFSVSWVSNVEVVVPFAAKGFDKDDLTAIRTGEVSR